MNFFRLNRLQLRSLLVIPIMVAHVMPSALAAGKTSAWEEAQNQGDKAQVEGQLLEAQAKFQDAANLAKSTYGVQSPQYLKSAIRLTSTLILDGHVDRAEPYYKQLIVLNFSKGKNGLIDPEIGVWVDDLGDTYCSHHDPKTREICLKHGLALKTRVHGEDIKYLGAPLNAVFEYYFNLGRYAEALPYVLERLKLVQANKNKDNGLIPVALTAVASTYFKLKQYRKAEEITTRLLDVTNKTRPDQVTELLLITQLQGYIQLNAGELDRAQKTFTDLTKIGPTNPKVFNLGRAQGWQGLGDVAQKKHDDKSAEKYYRQSVELMRLGFGATTKEQLVPATSLLQLLQKEGRTAEAAALEKQIQPIAALNRTSVSAAFPPFERQ
jgi:tetratricopeptide (TPR) repeat protein